jgi:hypothetical protein
MQGLWSESESQEIYPDPVHTLCICNVLEQLHERDESSSKWKKRLLGTFLTLQKAVGFEQQIKYSGSSERKKTKLDW